MAARRLIAKAHQHTRLRRRPSLSRESGSADQPDPFSPGQRYRGVVEAAKQHQESRTEESRHRTRDRDLAPHDHKSRPRRKRGVGWSSVDCRESTGALSYARGAYETCLKLPRSSDHVTNEAHVSRLHAPEAPAQLKAANSMALTVAIQMDPIERIDIAGDSTFALALEGQGAWGISCSITARAI